MANKAADYLNRLSLIDAHKKHLRNQVLPIDTSDRGVFEDDKGHAILQLPHGYSIRLREKESDLFFAKHYFHPVFGAKKMDDVYAAINDHHMTNVLLQLSEEAFNKLLPSEEQGASVELDENASLEDRIGDLVPDAHATTIKKLAALVDAETNKRFLKAIEEAKKTKAHLMPQLQVIECDPDENYEVGYLYYVTIGYQAAIFEEYQAAFNFLTAINELLK